MFSTNRPDLVLLDVIMPEMDGFMTCPAIRGLAGGAHTPVVMITALEDAETITRAFDAGATDFTLQTDRYADSRVPDPLLAAVRGYPQ